MPSLPGTHPVKAQGCPPKLNQPPPTDPSVIKAQRRNKVCPCASCRLVAVPSSFLTARWFVIPGRRYNTPVGTIRPISRSHCTFVPCSMVRANLEACRRWCHKRFQAVSSQTLCVVSMRCVVWHWVHTGLHHYRYANQNTNCTGDVQSNR